MNAKNLLSKFLTKRSWVIYFDYLFKYLPVFLLSSFEKHSKQLWLINERPDEAQDNGYFLFKWIREHHPEVRVYYAISKQSNDYEKVKQLGNVINWRSLQHFKCYVSATIICSTHFFEPHDLGPKITRRFMPIRGKTVFLQHGITKDDIPFYKKNNFNTDLFICAANPEWEYVSKNFGYEKDVVKCLGFARYDSLINTNEKKQILFMPTWRRWLDLSAGIETLKNSTFYKSISSFLCSPELGSFLSESKTELIFFLHPAFKSIKPIFESFSNEYIKVMNNCDIHLHLLLSSCTMFITDYSSAFFDVSYLNKPIIYWQFDRDEFRRYHYPTGYFSYDRDGFGPVISNFQDVISYLKELDKAGYVNPEVFSKRAENFYAYRDKNNCQRIFDELCKMESASNNLFD